MYVENQPLLAEAAFRGYIISQPADYFAKGIWASLEQMASYDVGPQLRRRLFCFISKHIRWMLENRILATTVQIV